MARKKKQEVAEVLKFNRKTSSDPMDSFVTVFYEDDLQVLWNRNTLLYIRTEEYNVDNHIVSIVAGSELQDAQRMAKRLYKAIAVEANRRV